MKTKVVYFIFSFFITFLLLISMDKYITYNVLKINIEMNVEKDIELQFFYTDEIKENFKEEKSFKYLFKADINKLEVVFPKNISNIKKFRIDFGREPGKIKIEKIYLEGNKKIKIDFKHDIRSINQLEIIEQDSNKLELFSKKIDPFIVFDENILNISTKNKYYFLETFTLIILIFFTIFKILLYLNKVKPKKKFREIYLIIAFIILIIPILKIDKKEKDDIENRNLSKKPSFIIENKINLNYGKEIEQWLNDHFFKREKILKFYKKLDRKLKNRVENEKVFMGKEKWLFYKGDNSIRNYQNIDLFTDEDLKLIVKNIKNRKKWLKKKGISYYLFIAPDKNKVYGEFYPNFIKKVNTIGRVEQLKESFNRNELEIIYPLERLLLEKTKSEDLLYYKTDTHWNSYGAFIGYEELLKVIKRDFVDIEEIKEKDLNISYKPYLNGDLGKMLSLNFNQYKKDNYKNIVIKNQEFEYIKNNPRGEGILTKSNKKYKVLILRDSFMTDMHPYISQTFGEVNYIWTHDFNSFQKLIEEYNPDIIIQEIVERYIFSLKKNQPKLEENNDI
ncbi:MULTISPECIES: alginate O-acetyltransferase AlgX-related protein [Fusobacterium]|uniref:alginate O-acetyltransferase AlgX-related protein n=1 Tax=Fusobacterium TaxID=848 RepID=UPI0025BD77A9|nr:hypothetical protein [Fusobacterium sp.]MCI7223515.1 hypothetical protein [Fusobacterium sp.]MDD7409794.1 hypothetical protein [Fusobacteriaceae bacterium]MDY5712916.1 hypothetical protein [Fusobacterium gastrosuis]